jgi:hypothetical protein
MFLLTGQVLADGGTVLVQKRTSNLVVTVFGSPSILRAGPVDLSVLVQEADNAAPVLDATVRLGLSRLQSGTSNEAWVPPCCSLRSPDDLSEIPATHAAAQNKLLYAATPQLPQSGDWQLSVAVRRGSDVTSLNVPLRIEPPAPVWTQYWFWFALPPVLVGLYVTHSAISRRGR